MKKIVHLKKNGLPTNHPTGNPTSQPLSYREDTSENYKGLIQLFSPWLIGLQSLRTILHVLFRPPSLTLSFLTSSRILSSFFNEPLFLTPFSTFHHSFFHFPHSIFHFYHFLFLFHFPRILMIAFSLSSFGRNPNENEEDEISSIYFLFLLTSSNI